MQINTVTASFIEDVLINTTAAEGIYFNAGGEHFLSRFVISNTGSSAVTAAGNPAKVSIRDGQANNSTNIGIYSNNTTTRLTVDSVDVNTVSGSGKAFYANGGDVTFNNCSATGAAANLSIAAGTNKRETNNSWNARVNYGTAAPAAGTWAVGDTTYNSAPAASGTMGWVCTTAGTPGTWKTFGTISS